MNDSPVRRYRLVIEGDDYTPLSALAVFAQALLRVPPGRSVGSDGVVEWECRSDEELAARDPSQDRETAVGPSEDEDEGPTEDELFDLAEEVMRRDNLKWDHHDGLIWHRARQLWDQRAPAVRVPAPPPASEKLSVYRSLPGVPDSAVEPGDYM